MKFSLLPLSVILVMTVSGCELQQTQESSATQGQEQVENAIEPVETQTGSKNITNQNNNTNSNTNNAENNAENNASSATENVLKRVPPARPIKGVVRQSSQKPIIDVETVKLVNTPQFKSFSAIITPNEVVEVHPNVVGVVSEVMFRQGYWVKKGEPLYRLKSPKMQTSVNTSKSAIKQAEAQLASAQTSHKKAKAMLTTNQSILKQAKADLKRYEKLIKDDAVSEQTYQQSVTNVKTAKSSLASTQALIAQTAADIKTAQANIKHARSRLSDTQQGLAQTVVKSPITGMVIDSTINKGKKVSIDQTDAFVTIAQMQPMFADITLTADELINIQQMLKESGKKASKNDVRLVLANGKTYAKSGTLKLTENKINNKNQAVMRVLFGNKNGILLPNMKVTAQVKLPSKKGVILLPPEGVSYMPLHSERLNTELNNKKGEGKQPESNKLASEHVKNNNTSKQSAPKQQKAGDVIDVAKAGKNSSTADSIHFVYVVDDKKRIHRQAVVVDGLYQGKIIVTKGLAEAETVVVGSNLPLVDKQVVVLQRDIDERNKQIAELAAKKEQEAIEAKREAKQRKADADYVYSWQLKP